HSELLRNRSVRDVPFLAVQNEMRTVLAGTRLHLHVCRIRTGFPLGERKRAELLAGYQFWKPFLFLFVRAKQQQRANPNGVMRVNEDRCRCTTPPDLFED